MMNLPIREISWNVKKGTDVCQLDYKLFPEVKWEDKEPKVITIEESPWIKLEDRLPNNNEKVVVLYKNLVTNNYSHIINTWYNGNWTADYTSVLVAIAWMPIPEFKE